MKITVNDEKTKKIKIKLVLKDHDAKKGIPYQYLIEGEQDEEQKQQPNQS